MVLPAPYGLQTQLPYSDSYSIYPQYPVPPPNFEMINNDPPPAYDQLFSNSQQNNNSSNAISNPVGNENEDENGNSLISSPMDTLPNVPDYAESERSERGRNSSRLETSSVTTENETNNAQEQLQIKQESENGQRLLVLSHIDSSAITNSPKSPNVLPNRLPPLQLKDDL